MRSVSFRRASYSKLHHFAKREIEVVMKRGVKIVSRGIEPRTTPKKGPRRASFLKGPRPASRRRLHDGRAAPLDQVRDAMRRRDDAMMRRPSRPITGPLRDRLSHFHFSCSRVRSTPTPICRLCFAFCFFYAM